MHMQQYCCIWLVLEGIARPGCKWYAPVNAYDLQPEADIVPHGGRQPCSCDHIQYRASLQLIQLTVL